MKTLQPAIPAFAGLSTKSTPRRWREFVAVLRKALCLTDPWIPAFVGMIGC